MHTQDTAPAHEASTTPKVQQPLIPQITIAVMGATGSGKTSFINMASSSSLRIGTNLKSCTAEVQLADEFILDGQSVILIDTPGFDDTSKTDTEILKTIAAFLATAYEAGSTLAGVIYMHPISNKRFSGIAARNFYMFRELCGDTTLRNVILVTNMWGEVPQDIGEAREEELATDFFKPALEKGARLARHHNTMHSAHDIIRSVMENRPAALRIQHELVEEGKDIVDTAAGETINKELNEEKRRHQAELNDVQKDMTEALEKKEEEIRNTLNGEMKKKLEAQAEQMREELADEARRLRDQINRTEMDSKTMSARYEEEKRKMEGEIGKLRHQWDTRPQGGCLIM